jgi:hypothetical protein
VEGRGVVRDGHIQTFDLQSTIAKQNRLAHALQEGL